MFVCPPAFFPGNLFSLCCVVFRNYVPVWHLSAVRASCLFVQCVREPSCFVRVCSGILLRHPSSLFVTFVRNMLTFRSSVLEFCSRLTSDWLVCSCSLFVCLHALLGFVRVYCSDSRSVCSLRLLGTFRSFACLFRNFVHV